MRHHILLALYASLLAVLSGCAGTAPTRFYVLSAMSDQPPIASERGVAIGVGPITLPEYLDRPQIVTRVGGNRLDFAEFDQWGGDLNDNVTRVLAANLSSLLKTDQVSLYPWKEGALVDAQVTIDVVNFERDVDGSSVLTAYWSIVDAQGQLRLMRRSTYRNSGAVASAQAPKDDQARSYDAIVAAMSQNLEALSRDIASAVTGLKSQ